LCVLYHQTNSHHSQPLGKKYGIIFVFCLIRVMASGGRPKPEVCLLSGRLRWTTLPKQRYSGLPSGRGLPWIEHPTF